MALTLTSVGTGTGAYVGTITGGAANALVGNYYTIAGFTNAANNGVFLVTASSATVLTTDNLSSVSETHAGTATLATGATATFTLNNFPTGIEQTLNLVHLYG